VNANATMAACTLSKIINNYFQGVSFPICVSILFACLSILLKTLSFFSGGSLLGFFLGGFDG